MADLWVPFVAAFIAAAAVLLVRQGILTVVDRRSAQSSRPVAGQAIIPVKNSAMETVRMPRVEITPGRSVSQVRPFTPIIIGSPNTIPQPTRGPVIVTEVMSRTAPTALGEARAAESDIATSAAVPEDMRVAVVPVADLPEPEPIAAAEPALEPEPPAPARSRGRASRRLPVAAAEPALVPESRASAKSRVRASRRSPVAAAEPALEPEPVAAAEPVEVMVSVASTDTAPRRETATQVEDDQSRRLRIAVGPGRPSTTIGAEAKVWSTWTQEVKTLESTPAQATAPAARDHGDGECPHCSSARNRGARFCGRCGRTLASAVTAS